MRGIPAALLIVAYCIGTGAQAKSGGQSPLIVESGPGFVIGPARSGSTVVYDPQDDAVVRHAAADLVDDVEAVSGARLAIRNDGSPNRGRLIVVGTLGRNRMIDRLVAERKLDVGTLRGAWESFVITTVRDPAPGVSDALVIMGSDRRGTAYGVYELAKAMGVSPWSWWADATPRRRPTLIVPAGTRRFGPPSVKYRGIFLNDEDWGLHPWAARTFDPKRGNIGPKTYERVFELLLRLKANTLWPAMHRTSAPFNSDSANPKLADEYGIVMGSSHAEPMLRNNVREWTGGSDAFNYATNPGGVLKYWEERVRSNAKYESLWTIGMRGIHDSGIQGATTTAQKVDLLDGIIRDQRTLLTKHVKAGATGIPTMFVPYKEVLDLYRGGLNVPEDVTLVWPDDNYGYIRQFPSATERERSGGGGVYYHLSYLGAPLAYLWLSTTPPSLVQEEMTRAYDSGMRTIWIANVGDIKPAEIGISHFMALAWDVPGTRKTPQRQWLSNWAGRIFGPAHGAAIGEILDRHFIMNFERRPEHLQWRKNGGEGSDGFTPQEADARLQLFGENVADVRAAATRISAALQNAFFELVGYPVQAAAAANTRFFATERYREVIDGDPVLARSAGAAAIVADDEIKALTDQFNNRVAGGKWRHMIAEEPADPQWQVFRVPRTALPRPSMTSNPAMFWASVAKAHLPASSVEAEDGKADARWQLVEGLGRGRGTMFARSPGARLAMAINIPAGAPQGLDLGLLPLFPDRGDALRFDVAIDGSPDRAMEVDRRAETPGWSRGVLDSLLRVRIADGLQPGRHTVVVTARGPAVAIDRLTITRPTKPSSGH